jgi:hypothetical protein
LLPFIALPDDARESGIARRCCTVSVAKTSRWDIQAGEGEQRSTNDNDGERCWSSPVRIASLRGSYAHGQCGSWFLSASLLGLDFDERVDRRDAAFAEIASG